MEFVTLHELSVILDTSVRVLRHRLRQMLQAGKLVENRDCRREDYVDETHFVWRISPEVFIRESGLRVVTKAATTLPSTVSKPDNQPPATHSDDTDKRNATLPNIDSKPIGMEREMIDFLKGQIGVKDRQIDTLTEQNQKLNDLNVKLVGQSVHQMQRIETLMRLTGGKIELSEVASKDGTPVETAGGTAVADATSRAA